jgi:transposase
MGSGALSVVGRACRRPTRGLGLIKIGHDRCGCADRDGVFWVDDVDDQRDRGRRRGDRGSCSHPWRRGAMPELRNVDPAGPRVSRTGACGCAGRRTACAGPCSGATDALSRARLFPADVPRAGPWCAGTLSTPDGAAECTIAQRGSGAGRTRRRVPKYRPTLVDPYRDHLRQRRAEQPGVPITQLLAEIRALGYPGSANLLTRYLNQGRAEDMQQHLSPRQAARLLLTRPANLTDRPRERLHQIADACPEIAAVRSLVAAFAALLTPEQDNPARLQAWMDSARSSDLPHVHSFVRGLNQDVKAVNAALSRPYHNGRTESVNTRTKMMSSSRGRFSPRLSQNRT